MSAETAILYVWVIWFVTWIAAAVFSSRTKVQMGRDVAGPYRGVASLGCLLLFMPTGAHFSRFGVGFARPLVTPLWFEPAIVKWAMLGLAVPGFGFCWWARAHLGRLWSAFVTLKEDHRIVDTGPYGLVRHPIYSGVIFAAVMTALIKATPAAMAGAVLVGVGFWMTARIEERFLRDQLGAEAYDAYSRRVAMLVPGLG